MKLVPNKKRNKVFFTFLMFKLGRIYDSFTRVEFKTFFKKHDLNVIISLKPLCDNIYQFLYLQKKFNRSIQLIFKV